MTGEAGQRALYFKSKIPIWKPCELSYTTYNIAWAESQNPVSEASQVASYT